MKGSVFAVVTWCFAQRLRAKGKVWVGGKVLAKEQPGNALDICNCKRSNSRSPKLLNHPNHDHSIARHHACR